MNPSEKVPSFRFATDNRGRPTSAEGWITTTPAKRDERAQSRVTQFVSGLNGSHLIPACFGGPGDAQNLVPMPERVNKSYVSAIEKSIGRHLKYGPVYLRVTVAYRGEGPVPSSVRHEFFRQAPGEGVGTIPGGDVITSVDIMPGAKMSDAIDLYTGRRLAPKDFLDVTNRRGLGPSGHH